MKKEEKYGLNLINLKNKEYQYNFLIENDFFAHFESSLIENAHVEVTLKMNKSETMLQLFFHFEGVVELVCDRSLDAFDYPLNFEEKMIFKFGEEEEVISEELEVISRNRTFIDLSQYFYEFINLAIPMKRLHPRYWGEQTEEEAENDDSLAMVYQSGGEEAENEDDKTYKADNDAQMSDPRWEALKKLKGNSN